jgi:hypothetical protein
LKRAQWRRVICSKFICSKKLLDTKISTAQHRSSRWQKYINLLENQKSMPYMSCRAYAFYLSYMKKIEDFFFYCRKNFVICSKIRADALFLSTAQNWHVEHVQHTFFCRADDIFLSSRWHFSVEQSRFLKKVSSSRDSRSCFSSSWPWLVFNWDFKESIFAFFKTHTAGNFLPLFYLRHFHSIFLFHFFSLHPWEKQNKFSSSFFMFFILRFE